MNVDKTQTESKPALENLEPEVTVEFKKTSSLLNILAKNKNRSLLPD